MSDWSDEYLTMLNDCENRQERLTEWECTFVDSMRSQISRGRRPTAKQIEILDRVWDKATQLG